MVETESNSELINATAKTTPARSWKFEIQQNSWPGISASKLTFDLRLLNLKFVPKSTPTSVPFLHHRTFLSFHPKSLPTKPRRIIQSLSSSEERRRSSRAPRSNILFLLTRCIARPSTHAELSLQPTAILFLCFSRRLSSDRWENEQFGKRINRPNDSEEDEISQWLFSRVEIVYEFIENVRQRRERRLLGTSKEVPEYPRNIMTAFTRAKNQPFFFLLLLFYFFVNSVPGIGV